MKRTQHDRSAATRAALVDAAATLFAERGYAAVSTDEIVRAAGVTRGALYHHYADKRELFEAVFALREAEVTDQVRAAMAGADDLVSGLLLALGAFLDCCADPAVQRISLTDAPAVLGWARWREIEEEHGLGLVVEMLEQARAAGLIGEQSIPVLARLLLSAVIEAGLLLADAEDKQATRRAVERSFGAWLAGLLANG